MMNISTNALLLMGSSGTMENTSCCATPCHKYRFLHHLDNSYLKVAAWLFSWDVGPEKHADRQTHYDYQPREAHITKLEQILRAAHPNVT